MKNLFLTMSLGLVSGLASANCVIELQYDGAVLGQNIFESQTCRQAMRDCKRTERMFMNQHNFSRDDLQCLNVSGSGSGGNNDPVRGLIKIQGVIERTPFEFTARQNEIIYSCNQAVSQLSLGSVDDMALSINGNAINAYKTSGWWRSASDICRKIDEVVTNSDIRAYQGPSIRISGTVESNDFYISAGNIGAAFMSCLYNPDFTSLENIDEMLVNINSRPTQRYTTSGWWNSTEACIALFQNI